MKPGVIETDGVVGQALLEPVIDRPVEGLETHMNRYGGDITQCPVLRNIGVSALVQIQAEVADIADKAEQFKGLSIDDLLASAKAPVEKETIEAVDTVLDIKATAAEHIVTQADQLIETVHLQASEWQAVIEEELTNSVDVVEHFNRAQSEPLATIQASNNTHYSKDMQNKDFVRDEHEIGLASMQVNAAISVPEQNVVSATHEITSETKPKSLPVQPPEAESYSREEGISIVESTELEDSEEEVVTTLPEPQVISVENVQDYLTDTVQVSSESHEIQRFDEAVEDARTVESLLKVLYDTEVLDQLEETELYQQVVEDLSAEVAQLVSELAELDETMRSEVLNARCEQITQLLIERYDVPKVAAEHLVKFVQHKFLAELQEEASLGIHQDLLNVLGTTEYRFYKAQSHANPHDSMSRLHRVSRIVMQLVMSRQELAVA